MGDLWRLPLESYKGLPTCCAPGVHRAVFALLMRYAQTSSRILDLASGSGAFLARLKDAGFCNLTGVERSSCGYQLWDVPCLFADLDQPFASQIDGSFDVITAIEIIEHLSSPMAFLLEVRKLLRPGGLLFISTPNVGELQSRIKFLLTRQLRYFDERQYVYQHHISPILPALLRLMLQDAGLRELSVTTAGSFDGPLRRCTIGAAASAIARITGPRRAVGECLLVLAQEASL
jgi:SAM-dependent methyltransferase